MRSCDPFEFITPEIRKDRSASLQTSQEQKRSWRGLSSRAAELTIIARLVHVYEALDSRRWTLLRVEILEDVILSYYMESAGDHFGSLVILDLASAGCHGCTDKVNANLTKRKEKGTKTHTFAPWMRRVRPHEFRRRVSGVIFPKRCF